MKRRKDESNEGKEGMKEGSIDGQKEGRHMCVCTVFMSEWASILSPQTSIVH